ncbi:MAG: DUF3791 domain-containing protein [Kiritimatiellae bacterium]|jgi:hypothetical protein|nr:DUF3791 domain-containing protein [Kiritimatiellia bacterium]
MPASAIHNARELEFAVFCIENLAAALGRPADAVYRALSGENGLLRRYILPSYDVLHTQGKEYIVEDILDAMNASGVVP